jgi:hypothetical protein
MPHHDQLLQRTIKGGHQKCTGRRRCVAGYWQGRGCGDGNVEVVLDMFQMLLNVGCKLFSRNNRHEWLSKWKGRKWVHGIKRIIPDQCEYTTTGHCPLKSVSSKHRIWWNLSRRGSVRKHPSMQHLAPGLCLEQTPKPIFGPCYGASRPLLYARPIPFVISLPLSYSSAMSHSPILTIHLTQACPTQMDTCPHYPYHAPLTIIANATHFGTLL